MAGASTLLATLAVASLVGLASGAPVAASNEGQLVPTNSSSAVAVVDQTVRKEGFMPVILLAANVLAWAGVETSLIMGAHAAGKWWDDYYERIVDVNTNSNEIGGKPSGLSEWKGFGPRVKTVSELGMMQPGRNLVYWFDFLDARMMIQGCTSCVELTNVEENLCRTAISTEAYISAFAVHLPSVAYWTMVELAYDVAHDVISDGAKDMAEDILEHLRSALLETQDNGHPHFNYHAESINSPSKVCRDVIGDPTESSFEGITQNSASGHYDRLIKSNTDCCAILGLQFASSWPFCFKGPDALNNVLYDRSDEENLCDEYHCGKECASWEVCMIYQGPTDSVRKCCRSGQTLKGGVCCWEGPEWQVRGDECVNTETGKKVYVDAFLGYSQRVAYSSCGAPKAAKDVHAQLAAGAFNHSTKSASADQVKAADADKIEIGDATDEIDVPPDGALPTPVSLPKLFGKSLFHSKANSGALGASKSPLDLHRENIQRCMDKLQDAGFFYNKLQKEVLGKVDKVSPHRFISHSGPPFGLHPDAQHDIGKFLEENPDCCEALYMTDLPFPAATGLDPEDARLLAGSAHGRVFGISRANLFRVNRMLKMETDHAFFRFDQYMFPCGGEEKWKGPLDGIHDGDFFTRNLDMERESRNAEKC